VMTAPSSGRYDEARWDGEHAGRPEPPPPKMVSALSVMWRTGLTRAALRPALSTNSRFL
jgi:hypothetical protein